MSCTAPHRLGVDVAKAHLDCHPDGAARGRRLPNTAPAIATLVADLARRRAQGQDMLVVLEASGGQERALRAALRAALHARYAACEQPRPTPGPDPALAALAELLAYRAQLRAELQARRQQLDGYAQDGQLAGRARKALDALDAERAEIDALIAAAIAAPPLAETARILISCPGVGPITCAALLVHLPELGRISDKQAASLAGLAPRAHESGTLKGRRLIQGGRPKLRRAL